MSGIVLTCIKGHLFRSSHNRKHGGDDILSREDEVSDVVPHRSYQIDEISPSVSDPENEYPYEVLSKQFPVVRS